MRCNVSKCRGKIGKITYCGSASQLMGENHMDITVYAILRMAKSPRGENQIVLCPPDDVCAVDASDASTSELSSRGIG